MKKRSLAEMNLLEDFLFNAMVTYPKIGEQFARILLKGIFGKDFGRLTVVPQKVYCGSDTDKRGTRLDVYLEAEEPGLSVLEPATVFDLEPNLVKQDIGTLSRRVRFYHAKIDAKSLEAGADYRVLKNVIIVFITPYDPFGLNRMVYTIRNMCEEERDMPYEDGARTLFLYTKGTEGSPPEELKRLLHYMEYTTEENAVTSELQEIQQMVDVVKRDEEVSLSLMKIMEREAWLIQQGIEQGIEQERSNTERERQRAEEAEKECARLRELLNKK